MKKTVRSLKLLFLVLVLASSAVVFSFSVSSLANDRMSEQELRANFNNYYSDLEYYDERLAYYEDLGYFTDPLQLMTDEEFCEFIVSQGLPEEDYVIVSEGSKTMKDAGRRLFNTIRYHYIIDVTTGLKAGAEITPDVFCLYSYAPALELQIPLTITSIAHYAEIGSDDVLSQMTTDECIDFVLKNGIEIPAELKEKSANLGQFIKNVIIRFEADGRPVSWEDNTAAEMEIPAFILQIRDAVEAFHAENVTDSVN